MIAGTGGERGGVARQGCQRGLRHFGQHDGDPDVPGGANATPPLLTRREKVPSRPRQSPHRLRPGR